MDRSVIFAARENVINQKPFNMNDKEWIKMFPKPMKINWSQPLTEEEKIKLTNQFPEITEFWTQEQKEIRLLKKMADKYERQASAKDSEISKERLKMRLRKKLANKKEARGKGKDGHLCSKCSKECQKQQRKRAKKLAAKKKIDAQKTKDPEHFSEEQQKNLEGEKDYVLYQYRDPDISNDDDEKEDSQYDEEEDIAEEEGGGGGEEEVEEEHEEEEEVEEEVKEAEDEEEVKEAEVDEEVKEAEVEEAGDKALKEENNNSDNDGQEVNADVNKKPQGFRSLYQEALSEENHQHYVMKMREKMNFYGNAYQKYLNMYHSTPNLDDLHHFNAVEDFKTDAKEEGEMQGLRKKALAMSEGPQPYHGEEVLIGEEEDIARYLQRPQEKASASSSSAEHDFFNDFT